MRRLARNVECGGELPNLPGIPLITKHFKHFSSHGDVIGAMELAQAEHVTFSLKCLCDLKSFMLGYTATH